MWVRFPLRALTNLTLVLLGCVMNKIKLIHIAYADEGNYYGSSISEIKEESDWFEISDEDLVLINSYINKGKYSGNYEIVRFLDHTKLIENTLLVAKDELDKQAKNMARIAKREEERKRKLRASKEENDRKKYEQLKKKFGE